MIVVDFPPMTCCVRAHASRHALKAATTLLAGPLRLTLTAADVVVLTPPGGWARRGPVGGAAGSQPAAGNVSAERDASQAPFRLFVVVACRGPTKELQVIGPCIRPKRRHAAKSRHFFVSSGARI
jgi:hypothetical protein